MAMDTLYDYHIWQPQEGEGDLNVTMSNSHLLPCDCFLFHLHFRHVLQSNHPQEFHLLLNSSLSSFLIPCNVFLATGSSILIAVFSDTGVAQDFLDTAVPDVLSVAADIACNPLNAGRRILPLAVSVLVVSPYNEREEIGRVLRESSAQPFKTLPASETAIEGLKNVDIDVGGELLIGECRICLDELMNGMEVTRLPCAHVYHRDCIVKWLETSHLCPLCRYAMPLS
ncbi:E3 ubiquitin-protein ligase RING1-like [Benincasa hispida]|uniref:E3 ubiquitin-protein ligase RING1-like n=1 Tax=Benincasa hispida TaxID=102211 RepID=UPI001902B404|nr:E3 ubiquitin-protein ligase RING1-like [Benincasa hispida]